MTHNEIVQAYLTEGLKAARAAKMPAGLEADYCAVYLAGKLASRDEASTEKFSYKVEEIGVW